MNFNPLPLGHYWFTSSTFLFYGARCHNAFLRFEQSKSNCHKYPYNQGIYEDA